MELPFSARQAELVAKAYTTGVETSIAELADLLGLAGGRLDVARLVVDFVTNFKLELVPDPSQAEFDSTRVLRAESVGQDPLAEVKQLITAGESASIEFKSSMLCCMHEWKKSGTRVERAALPGEMLKTVCAFLNSDGGDLIVGVNDDQEVCPGIRLDMELKGWDLDKWQLHFQSLVAARFHDGAMVQPHLRTEMVSVGKEAVFRVRVMPRARRSFVKRESGKPYEFFVRNGPRTDALDLPAFYSTIAAEIS